MILWEKISFIKVYSEPQNENRHGGNNGCDNSIITISGTKSNDITNFAVWIQAVLIPVCSTLRFQNKLHGFMPVSQKEWVDFLQNIAVQKTLATLRQLTNKKANLSMPLKGMLATTPILFFISVRTGGTSSFIPHRLNNSSQSTSLLHIKKQCTTRVVE